MAGVKDYRSMYESFRRRGNFSEVFDRMLEKVSAEADLSAVTSCVCVGPGNGLREIRLAQLSLPNLRTFIAVEPDRESLDELRSRLQVDLPGVVGQIFQTTVGDWTGPDEPVDAFLLFDFLYYVGPSERKALFSKIERDWLTPNGRVLIMSLSRLKSLGHDALIYERLGRPLLSWEHIKADLRSVGFVEQNSFEMNYARDYSDPDEDLLRFYQHQVDPTVTLEDVRRVISELFPEGKADQTFFKLSIFKRAAI